MPTLTPPFSDADWSRLERDWTAWWNHDLSRPMLVATRTRPAERPRPSWWENIGKIAHDIPAEAVAKEVWDDICRTSHAGDAWPRTWINFGPGVGAAFLGAAPDPAPDTMWFHPGIWKNKPLEAIRPAYDPDNKWWRRVQDLTRACIAEFDGRAQVGFTDIGGNLDIAASLRETQSLLLDCLDDPDAVGDLCRRITPLWLRYYGEQHGLIGPAGRGTSAWAPLWSPRRTYMLQCDFSYMISPELFERWVVPDIAECCARMEHGFYHLDGKGELPHLDHLLAIPELKGVQWIPGAGQPEAGDPVWWPVLKRIRDAGKLAQIYTSAETALRMAREMALDGFTIDIGGSDPSNHADVIALIHRENAALAARSKVALST